MVREPNPDLYVQCLGRSDGQSANEKERVEMRANMWNRAVLLTKQYCCSPHAHGTTSMDLTTEEAGMVEMH